MNAPQLHSSSAAVGTMRVVLGGDNKVSTVALDLVRAAAEYRTVQDRHGDVTALVTEFSGRFGLEPPVVEALLAGDIKADVQGDQLVVDVDQTPPCRQRARNTRCTGLIHHHAGDQAPSEPVDPSARARRMQSVMLFHAASCGAREQSVGSLAQLCEFLCDVRHWCDEYMVDIYKAMDQSYVRYMHNKYQGLNGHSS